MRNHGIGNWLGGAALAALVVSAAWAQPVAIPARTIFLAATGVGTPMTVAFHPGFSRYYTGFGGNPSDPAFVYSAGGGLLQTLTPSNIDTRSWYYNPGTAQIEAVTFDAKNGGAARGLILPGVNGSGDLTGATSTLLASLPGLVSSQTMPAYDPANNVLYSRDSGGAVNVVSRATGVLGSTINLDLAAAGNPTVVDFALGYDPVSQWLIVVSPAPTNRAFVFTTAGAYVGSSQLDISFTNDYGMGFTNGQLFVYDPARQGFQGYNLGAGAPPVVAVLVPTLADGVLLTLAALLLLAGASSLRRRVRR